MGMMIGFVSHTGEKIAVNIDHIIYVKEHKDQVYKTMVIYGVSDERGGTIFLKEPFEDVVNYINTGKWQKIR